MNDLSELMKKFNITQRKQTVLFDSNLETKGAKPILKEKSVARMVELKEEYILCDIWRIRNPPKKSFTFPQNHPLRYYKSQTRLTFYLKQA